MGVNIVCARCGKTVTVAFRKIKFCPACIKARRAEREKSER